MSTQIPYEHKGAHRNDYSVDKTRLDGFHALESDWREVLRWIISVASTIPFYEEDVDDTRKKISDLWSSQVLTVLVELSQKDYDEYISAYIESRGTKCQDEYTEKLVKKVEEWNNRLEEYKAIAYRDGTQSKALRVAEELHRKLKESTSKNFKKHKENNKSELDYNRPFFTMIGALSEIQSKFEYYFSEIESSGDMDASLALLLTFTKHYCRIVEKFNQKFEDLPDFYRHEILKAVVQEAVQDSAGVIVKPNPEHSNKTFSLPEGTRFPAGDNLYYSLSEKSYVIPTVLNSVYTLFKQNNNIVTAPVSIAGDETMPLFAPDNQANRPLQFGWALSSHILTLVEGDRKVCLSFVLTNDAETEMLRCCAKSLFKLYFSGIEGWVERTFDISRDTEASLFTLTFSIADDEQSPVLCSKDIHGMDSDYPAIRILVNEIPQTYDRLSSISFTDIYIKVDVSGIHSFSLTGDIGEMDPGQPFYPFGTSGEKGSWFIFGSQELAMKHVLYVSMKGTWNKLPDGGYKQLYANYQTPEPITDSCFKVNCEWQENNCWNTCLNSPMPLFNVDHSGKVVEDAELRFVLFEESPRRLYSSYPYRKKSKSFYRVKLSAPAIGFGMETYRRQFAETMIHNSKAKEKKQLPVPAMPQVPVLADVTIGYCAVCHIKADRTDDRLFRITETIGYEECDLSGSISLLPDMGAHYMLLELQKASGVKHLKLYFNIGDSKDGISSSESGLLVIEIYNSSGSIWSRFPAECILKEETIGLTRSGYIELNMADEEVDSSVGDEHVWIRIGFEENKFPKNIIVKGIYLNYFHTIAEDGDGSPLPAGTITSTVEEDIRIAEIIQPNAGYGGKRAENSESLSIRQSTRVSTRNRAVNITDYERMLLERFTDIEKVCCVPVSEQRNDVSIVVFPKPRKRTLPLLPNWQLAEMEAYLKSYTSPFVKFNIINPAYESMTITVTAIMKESVQDEGEVQRRLRRRIYKYFIPWFTSGELPTLNKHYSYEEVKSWLANDEGIERFVSLEISGGKSIEINDDNSGQKDIYYYGSTECSVIYPVNIIIELSYRGKGIGDSGIGTNFIIK